MRNETHNIKIVRIIEKVLLLISLIIMTACALNLPANYQMSDTARRVNLSGDFYIGEVRYLPAEQGKVKANEIENTSFGLGLGYNLEKNIADIVGNAMMHELTAAGAKYSSGSNKLVDIIINEASGKERGLGYGGVRVYLNMDIRVKNRNGQVLYVGHLGQLVKDPGVVSSWNDDFMVLIRETIGMYMVDTSFQKALSSGS